MRLGGDEEEAEDDGRPIHIFPLDGTEPELLYTAWELPEEEEDESSMESTSGGVRMRFAAGRAFEPRLQYDLLTDGRLALIDSIGYRVKLIGLDGNCHRNHRAADCAASGRRCDHGLAIASPLGALEVSGRVEIEPRAFLHAPEHRRQKHHALSFAVQPEFYHSFDDDRQSLVFTPFVRLDTADDRRSRFDVRELMYQRVFDEFELRAGIGRVFWGVTESYHLVDVINQTDLVETIDLDEKLGQPLLNLTLARDWGVLDAFVLPGFRERTYPGREGRLRSEPFVDTSRATYESGAGRDRVDLAVRWSNAIGDFDIGVAHFRGTSREPRLLPVHVCADGSSASPFRCPPSAPPVELVLAPRYEVVDRTSLDLQATKDATLWKLEALHESGRGGTYVAWVGGFEYTWYGINDSDSDLGLLVEHLFDGRGGRAPHPLGERPLRRSAARTERRGGHRARGGIHRRRRR